MKNLIALLILAVALQGCASWNKQQKGTAYGAGAGAAAGAAIGAAAGGGKGSIIGALVGAAVGGVAGNQIGKAMDKQAQELEQAVPTAEVKRVEEGINMTFDASLAFEINSAELSNSYKEDLEAAAAVFQKYADTNLLIEGHTDDTGSEEYNMQLSEKRAKAVSAFLTEQGIDPSRMIEKWYGESQPKYPNDEENRPKNRRVEVAIYANEDMVAKAETGKL